jgi:hypothetical protein
MIKKFKGLKVWQKVATGALTALAVAITMQVYTCTQKKVNFYIKLEQEIKKIKADIRHIKRHYKRK